MMRLPAGPRGAELALMGCLWSLAQAGCAWELDAPSVVAVPANLAPETHELRACLVGAAGELRAAAVVSDEEPELRITNVPRGDYRLLVTARDFRARLLASASVAELRVGEGQRRVPLELEPASDSATECWRQPATCRAPAETRMPCDLDLPGGNLLRNGGFEEPAADSGTPPGWRVVQPGLEVARCDTWVAAAGCASLALSDGERQGEIQQVAETVPGQSYCLSFDYSGRPWDGAGGWQLFNIVVQGRSQLLWSHRWRVFSEADDMRFWPYRVTVVADAPTTAVTFVGRADEGRLGAVIDNVALVEGACEPLPCRPVQVLPEGKVNLVVNGDFEALRDVERDLLSTDGWVERRGVSYAVDRMHWDPWSGCRSLQLRGDLEGPNEIEQRIPTEPGRRYCLRFAHGNDKRATLATAVGRVELHGKSELLSETVSHFGGLIDEMRYGHFTRDFVADDTAVTLRFIDGDDPEFKGWVIDAVSVVEGGCHD